MWFATRRSPDPGDRARSTPVRDRTDHNAAASVMPGPRRVNQPSPD
ncbi:hypothetical protein HMPREF9622_01162 [Cutibacterium modestum HL037PA3]|nr:hypothetical protein HMPREF9621_00775 [Cutibacterium modestum HL037PA2]EFT15733.1 hypothetical protein HMPREF9622_01162 [Cutibacterium modestum HL037PA3]EGG26788.1 hypothetical protein PA08_1023 [Cutibacterium modestum P08]